MKRSNTLVLVVAVILGAFSYIDVQGVRGGEEDQLLLDHQVEKDGFMTQVRIQLDFITKKCYLNSTKGSVLFDSNNNESVYYSSILSSTDCNNHSKLQQQQQHEDDTTITRRRSTTTNEKKNTSSNNIIRIGSSTSTIQINDLPSDIVDRYR